MLHDSDRSRHSEIALSTKLANKERMTGSVAKSDTQAGLTLTVSDLFANPTVRILIDVPQENL